MWCSQTSVESFAASTSTGHARFSAFSNNNRIPIDIEDSFRSPTHQSRTSFSSGPMAIEVLVAAFLGLRGRCGLFAMLVRIQTLYFMLCNCIHVCKLLSTTRSCAHNTSFRLAWYSSGGWNSSTQAFHPKIREPSIIIYSRWCAQRWPSGRNLTGS